MTSQHPGRNTPAPRGPATAMTFITPLALLLLAGCAAETIGSAFAIKDKQRSDFATDVPVKVHDAKGHAVLDAIANGPFLLA